MTPETMQQLIVLTYIIAVVGFILALKWLSSPASAMRGVLIGDGLPPAGDVNNAQPPHA